jgi:hypothetical protein
MRTIELGFTAEDYERFRDRLAHAEQYLNESLEAVREAIALAVKAGWEDDED